MKSSLFGMIAALLSVANSDAQSLTTLVAAGDPIAGVGQVFRVLDLAVNNDGDWRVKVESDHWDSGSDCVLLLNGSLELREGQTLFGTENLGAFGAIGVPSDVTPGWKLWLDGPSGTLGPEGIFHGAQPLILEGDGSTASTLGPAATYLSFDAARAIPGTILFWATLFDPAASGGGLVYALVKANHDGAGTLLSEDVLVASGDVLPGQTESVSEIETGPSRFDMNQLGDVLYTVDLSGDSSVDHAVYLNSTLLSQEGSPSSVAGRNWSSLSAAGVRLNDCGDTLVVGTLDGDSDTRFLIEKNGVKFRQSGDTLPAIGGFQLTLFSYAVDLANNGDVLWWGRWNDPDSTRNEGLFLNDRLIVQKGVTLVDGAPIADLPNNWPHYTMSPNGRFILFECFLATGDRAVLIDRGGLADFPSCTTNLGTLKHSEGVPAIGQSFSMSFDDGPAAGSLPFLAVSNAPIATSPPCGLSLPFGELMIGVGAPNPIVLDLAPAWSPGSASVLGEAVPNDPGLVGREFWVQGVFYNGASSPVLRLTNAYVMTIGEPG